MKPATERFSDRADDYARYRPSYPPDLLGFLRDKGMLQSSSVVADVGSGTGLLARLFVEGGQEVYAIEPNRDMRNAGEHALKGQANFHSVAGRAEDTMLPSGSVDMITAAQAFHWFDRCQARNEFGRILRPPGWVVLIWNERETSSPFLRDYEELLRAHAHEYLALSERHINDQHIGEFFAPASFEMVTFGNAQRFDFKGLRGRLLSSSYTPMEHELEHAPMIRALHDLFERHAERDRVEFIYQTRVYYGRLL